MTLLYLAFRVFDEFNGISKKIRYQIDAFRANGVDVRTSYLEFSYETDISRRMVDGELLEDYGKGIISKFKKRYAFGALCAYISENKIDTIYIRYDHNASWFLLSFLKRIKKSGVRILMEIPTYPYDDEYKNVGLGTSISVWAERYYRRYFYKYIDKVITFSEDDFIFRIPTIKISNGIDFDAVRIKKSRPKEKNELRLISVAEIHSWHGFDRLIKGLGEYYKKTPTVKVYYDIIGYTSPEYLSELETLVKNNNVEEYVTFHGSQYGEALDAFFDRADMGVASLGRHRCNIFNIKTLKNREYAARGIPFCYSETDSDFENKPYILKIAADETSVNIEQLVDFYRNLRIESEEIRNSISHLSWNEQMGKVLENM